MTIAINTLMNMHPQVFIRTYKSTPTEGAYCSMDKYMATGADALTH